MNTYLQDGGTTDRKNITFSIMTSFFPSEVSDSLGSFEPSVLKPGDGTIQL